MPDYTELREALAQEGLTEGPWELEADNWLETTGATPTGADARLIAAADPTTLRSLLAERDAAVARVAELEGAVRKAVEVLEMYAVAYDHLTDLIARIDALQAEEE